MATTKRSKERLEKEIQDIIQFNEYENRILELFDCQDDMTRSDLQGAVGAIIMGIILDERKRWTN